MGDRVTREQILENARVLAPGIRIDVTRWTACADGTIVQHHPQATTPLAKRQGYIVGRYESQSHAVIAIATCHRSDHERAALGARIRARCVEEFKLDPSFEFFGATTDDELVEIYDRERDYQLARGEEEDESRIIMVLIHG